MSFELTESLDAWVGRTDESVDQIAPAPMRLMKAMLDTSNVSTIPPYLPPLWHWLYFLQGERQSHLGRDGLPKRCAFWPPIALPRHQWVGGWLHFVRPLAVGAKVRRASLIKSVKSTTGCSGETVSVTVQHDISDEQGVVLHEEQDIVYFDTPASGFPVAQPSKHIDEQFSRTITPDPVQLMRYSALTYNSHRIHYDRTYAVKEEGCLGLVVHGPLVATLLLEELRRVHPDKDIHSFEFKQLHALYDVVPFTIAGRIDGHTAHLWARDPEGRIAMQASVDIK